MVSKLAHLKRRYALWVGERRFRHSIVTVREAMGMLGFPVDHLSDEELMAGTMRLAEASASTGMHVAEAAVLFAALSQVRRGR